MSFRYLNLKRVKELINPKHTNKLESPERRKFVKTMGFGIIAANPIINTVDSLANTGFEIRNKNKYFAVIRNGKVVWEINQAYFGADFTLQVIEKENAFLVSAKHLKIIHTSLSFDLIANITKQSSRWNLDFSIPQFSLNEQVDFIDWLDRQLLITSNIAINTKALDLNNTDNIALKGLFDFEISPDWDMNFTSQSGISLAINNKSYLADKLLITKNQNALHTLVSGGLHNAVHFTVKGSENWKQLVADFNIDETQTKLTTADSPAINFSLATTSKGKLYKALWVSEQKGKLHYTHNTLAGASLLFTNYFYLSDYGNSQMPSFYISAKMPDKKQHFSNAIGSFSLKSNQNNVELELFGEGNTVIKSKIEPLFSGFRPRIQGAMSLPVPQTQDHDKISLAVNTTEKSDNTKTPKALLAAKGESLEYSPKRPLKIRVLRAEDMVHLEFEFYNFKFVNKNGITPAFKELQVIPKKESLHLSTPKTPTTPSRKIPLLKKKKQTKTKKIKPLNNAISGARLQPIGITNGLVFDAANFSSLELDNPREKGIVIIYFPTQHTLEEAYYETNANLGDNGSNDPVQLPTRHLRAEKSRLVYELKAGHKGFPLTMNELLDWSKFTLKVDGRAYINLKDFSVINKPTYKLTDNKQPVFYAEKLQKKSDIKYGLKLSDKKVLGNKKLHLYKENKLNNVLFHSTLKTGYHVKLNKKVAEIDKMSTSIEAPALLYISPNQVNDFHHRKNIDQVSVFTESVSKGVRKVKPIKTLSNLSIKPINKFTLGKGMVFNASKTGVITELWHTHLGVKLKNGQTTTALDKLKTIRALWAYDAASNYNNVPSRNLPFRASLDANNRHKLVHLTSNYQISNYKPQPVPVKRLILSNMGAYLEWQAHFNTPQGAASLLNIVDWEHQATLGRDHYVKIVEEGYLFPFGHRAAMVTVTERKFDKRTKAAANKQHKYIVLLQESVTYERNDASNKFIKFPFQEVKIRTTKTPSIDKPSESAISDDTYFLIEVGGKAFQFDLFMYDKEGDEHYFKMPLVFVENGAAINKNSVKKLRREYRKTSNDKYTDINAFGQKIAYSESFIGGDTAFETESIHFGIKLYDNNGRGIAFHPIMRSSQVFIDAVDKMTNTKKPVEISLVDDNNPGKIFAKVKDTLLNFADSSETSGGFLTPNMPINALSKIQGAVGGALDDLKNLRFDPSSIFGGLDDLPIAEIFGVIKLLDLFADINELSNVGAFVNTVNAVRGEIELIKRTLLLHENELLQEVEELDKKITEIEDTVAETQAEIERRINEVEQEVQQKINDLTQQIETTKKEIEHKIGQLITKLKDQVPKIPNLKTYFTDTAFIAEYKFQPEFKSKKIVIFENLLNVEVADKHSGLKVLTTLKKPYSVTELPTLSSYARFDKFAVDVEPLLKVSFEYIEYSSGSAAKTDVKIQMADKEPIQFKGALSFVNNLQDIIPIGGFSKDGPYIDLQPTGVRVGFNMSVPNLEVGALMITNISLGAYVMLPFTGAPLTMGFNFCTRENPFLLTISGFGGGGYFMMLTTLSGIQSLEAAFEFGAAMSLNLGVASGSVTVMGGFYYKLELIEVDGEEVSEVSLSGYLRMNGRLSVLGLIHASLEFYLALNAVIVDGKVSMMEGTATLKVRVEVLFFSKTVTVSVRRELHGADADPKFIEMVDQDDWLEYCSAFAS